MFAVNDTRKRSAASHGAGLVAHSCKVGHHSPSGAVAAASWRKQHRFRVKKNCEEEVRTTDHAQIRSIFRVLRSLGPRSQGETAYSPNLLISGTTPEGKTGGRADTIHTCFHGALHNLSHDKCLSLAQS
jgi:hypothetical protein